MKKAMKRHGKAEAIVTHGLRPYPAAMRELGNEQQRRSAAWAEWQNLVAWLSKV